MIALTLTQAVLLAVPPEVALSAACQATASTAGKDPEIVATKRVASLAGFLPAIFAGSSHVLGVGDEFKVRGSHAAPDSTEVVEFQPARLRAVLQFPKQDMDLRHPLLGVADSQLPVAMTSQACYPDPTGAETRVNRGGRAVFVNLRPESIHDWDSLSHTSQYHREAAA